MLGYNNIFNRGLRWYVLLPSKFLLGYNKDFVLYAYARSSATIEIFARLQPAAGKTTVGVCSATIEIFARLQRADSLKAYAYSSATIEIFARLQLKQSKNQAEDSSATIEIFARLQRMMTFLHI